jgi:hypothetical protein
VARALAREECQCLLFLGVDRWSAAIVLGKSEDDVGAQDTTVNRITDVVARAINLVSRI